MKARVGAGLAAGGQKEYHPLQESILRQLFRKQSCFRYTKRMSLSHKASSRRADSRGPTPRNDAGRRFFADETCNHHAAACSSLPGRCLRARRTRPPPQQRPLGVTEACLFTKQLVQDRLLQWISLFLPSVPTNVQGRLAAQTGPAERSLSHASRHTSCFRDASISASPTCSITYESRAYLGCGNTRTRD